MAKASTRTPFMWMEGFGGGSLKGPDKFPKSLGRPGGKGAPMTKR